MNTHCPGASLIHTHEAGYGSQCNAYENKTVLERYRHVYTATYVHRNIHWNPITEEHETYISWKNVRNSMICLIDKDAPRKTYYIWKAFWRTIYVWYGIQSTLWLHYLYIHFYLMLHFLLLYNWIPFLKNHQSFVNHFCQIWIWTALKSLFLIAWFTN